MYVVYCESICIALTLTDQQLKFIINLNDIWNKTACVY